MDKQIKVEEKLTKKKEIFQKEIQRYFLAIVKSPDTKVFDIEDIQKNKESFQKVQSLASKER